MTNKIKGIKHFSWIWSCMYYMERYRNAHPDRDWNWWL